MGISSPKAIGKNARYEMKECLDVLQGMETTSGTTTNYRFVFAKRGLSVFLIQNGTKPLDK